MGVELEFLSWMIQAENLFQHFDGGKLFISYRLQWSVRAVVLECSSQITDGAGYVVLVIVVWDCKIMRRKGNSVGNSFSPGNQDVCLVTAVVFWAVINIPIIDTMLSPSFAFLRSFID